MQILFLGLAPPIPTTNGHRVRCRSLLATLAEEGHEVTLVSFADSNEFRSPAPDLFDLCTQVRLVPMPSTESTTREYWGRLRGLISSIPYGAQRLRSKMMKDAIRDTLKSRRFDAVICDDIYMLANLPPKTEIPILLNKHDITHEIMRRFLRYQKNPLKRLYGQLEYSKVRRLEINACTHSTAVLTCSERDAGLIRGLCTQAQVRVLPNVVDVGSFQPTHEDDGRTALFVGAMDWFPNRDAVDYFVTEILPVLRELVSGLRFVVAGRNPSQSMLARYRSFPDVEFTGNVADMRPLIANAAVCVVPLRIGSGTRLKILEAAAMGKPVVSTRLGAEGLDFFPGKEILLADDPREFANEIAGLLADWPRRRTLGQAARRCVEKRYDLSNLRTALRTALGELALEPAQAEKSCGAAC